MGNRIWLRRRRQPRPLGPFPFPAPESPSHSPEPRGCTKGTGCCHLGGLGHETLLMAGKEGARDTSWLGWDLSIAWEALSMLP